MSIRRAREALVLLYLYADGPRIFLSPKKARVMAHEALQEIEDVENEPVPELRPEWAAGKSDGDYTAIGAVLPTRDGRASGNAIVISVRSGDVDFGTIITTRTDAGNVATYTLPEIKTRFHPPEWIGYPYSHPRSHVTGGTL